MELKEQLINQISKILKMKLIATKYGYSYYIGIGKKEQPFYNVVPENHSAPKGGYYSSEYICKIKNVPNLFSEL